jgi:hypothetical protein
MTRLVRTGWILSFWTSLLALVGPGLCAEVAVVAESDQSVDFVYEIGKVQEIPVGIDGTIYKELLVEGCWPRGEPGEPALPVKEIIAGIPLDARPTVEVVDLRTRSVRNLLVAPVPFVTFDSTGVDRYEYRPDPVSYGRAGLEPALLASLGGVGFVRNQRVAHILLSVARYDADRTELELCEKIRVRVRFNRTGKGAGSGFQESGFERVYQSAIANYDQSRNWRSLPKLSVGAPAFGNWLRMSVVEEGTYMVDYCDLRAAGVLVDVVDPRTFILVNGGSKPLPESLTEPRPDSVEVSIYVEGEEDGRLDPSDYLVFSAVSLTGYSYNPAADSFSYFLNPYAQENVYWLGWGGEPGPRMAELDVNPNGQATAKPTSFDERAHLEKEVESPLRSGLRWIWHRLRREREASSSFTTVADVSAPASSTCELSLSFFVESDTVMNIKLYLNGEVVCDQPGPRHSGMYDPPFSIGGTAHGLVNGDNQIRVELAGGPADSVESILIDFLEMKYSRRLELEEGRLEFSTGTSPVAGRYEYRLRGAAASSMLLDITDPFHPVRLVNHRQVGESAVFQVDVTGTRIFSAATEFMVPGSIELDDPHNLKGGGADYLAICHEPFMPAVSDLVSWRNSHIAGMQSPRAIMVTVSDVMDNFSWGVVDPTAIRDFLAWTLGNWSPAPSYCLLVGASTYDYKNNLGLTQPKNLIPPHVEGYVVVSGNEFPEEENPCYDDWFVWLTAGDRDADMFIGRFDAISGEEARILALRAMNHEREEFLGAWRKQCLLVADDQEPYSGDSQFTTQNEALAKIVPADIDVLKVYMVEYSKIGEEKPDARDAMVNSVNKGILSGSFLGHGNIKQLAHEKVFRSPEDVERLTNGRMVPLFFYGSCSVGLLDRPTASSMGSLASKVPAGGNLVSLAASRPTFGGANALLVNKLFDNIYNVDSLRTSGEIVYDAKLTVGAARAELYILYGDPGVRITPPGLSCSLTVLPESLIGLSQVTVQGTVSDAAFDGWAMVKAFDSAHMESDTSEMYGSVVNYELPGEPFHWAIEPVNDGRFTHTFRVPKIEARSIREGEDGRVSVYVWNNEIDGSGAVDSLYVGGNAGPVTDFTGPAIRILYDGREVKDSVSVRLGSKLVGVVSDESGIYLGTRPDKILRMVVNGDELNSVHLNGEFNYDQGTDTLGRFAHVLELTADSKKDSLKFVASDNFLNTSQLLMVVVPVGPDKMKLADVMNYPNPFDRDTYFTFTVNQPGRISIRVYTIGGRLIKMLTGEFDTSGYHQIYWNGLDEEGDVPSNGVYLYKLVAETSGYTREVTASSKAEVVGKLLIVR